MPQECTTLVTIWPATAGQPMARYELWENFRPVWRLRGQWPLHAVVSGLDHPLATVLALHLQGTGGLAVALPQLRWPTASRAPLGLDHGHAHRLYRLFRGRCLSVVRYPGSLVDRRELSCLGRAGVRIDFHDSAWTPFGGAR